MVNPRVEPWGTVICGVTCKDIGGLPLTSATVEGCCSNGKVGSKVAPYNAVRLTLAFEKEILPDQL